LYCDLYHSYSICKLVIIKIGLMYGLDGEFLEKKKNKR
jgi:hypothetical protein